MDRAKLATKLAAGALLVGLTGARAAQAAPDPFAWAPRRAPAVTRGHETAARFGIAALTEVEVEVDDVYDAANRHAVELAEQRLAAVPGVRAVFGPAGLLDITVDASGKPSAQRVLGRGRGAIVDLGRIARGPGAVRTLAGAAAQEERENEEARQRVVRRADALGWFLTENGRRVRFLVDVDDWEKSEPALAAAIQDSGLSIVPSTGALEARPLWPDPRRHRARLLPPAFAAAWIFFVLVAVRRARFPLGRRRVSRALAAAAAAAAPFVLVPVAGVRWMGATAALAAAAVALFGTRARDAEAIAVQPRAAGLPWILGLSAALVLETAALAPRVRVETRQWSAAPMFFVSVRGDLDEPVVLRELRRMTDDLRAQPGVANAWSVADLFLGITFAGKEASGIPDDPEELRRILVQARTDPAVRLELSADHREALIGVRFDDDPTVDHAAIVAHAQRYADRDLRHALARVELNSPATDPTARLVGEGLLAGDLAQRVGRICARSGRPLSPAEALSVRRTARAVALIPIADPSRLDGEIGDAVRDFARHHPFPLTEGQVERLVLGARALATGASTDDVRTVVEAVYGPRMPPAVVNATAASLARRLAALRLRHTARIDFREMLYGANLPTEGVLADEVRSATLEGMGPLVGLPVAADAPAALHLDALSIGGVPCDRALSEVWNRALRPGLIAASATIAILLVLAGGLRGVLGLPLALAPLAAATLPAALLREPIGLPMLAFFGGAFAGGAFLAIAAIPGPREWRWP
ncbi:MAG TPA: hypothetical protein VHM31_13575 [Polyangia bacterium]|nr:hypothetical protein [Polyangia bacterium]